MTSSFKIFYHANITIEDSSKIASPGMMTSQSKGLYKPATNRSVQSLIAEFSSSTIQSNMGSQNLLKLISIMENA